MRQMPQIFEGDRIDFRVTLSRHPERDADDGHGRQDEQQDRDRTFDDDGRLRHTFTNFLKSTFKINPVAMKNIMVAEPP
jgi:hypothetical protein